MGYRIRRLSAGAGLAGCAVAAATMVGLGTGHADPATDGLGATDLDLLHSAAANLPGAPFESVFGQFEAYQTPLLTSDNSFFSGLGALLFYLPDQQLNQASEALLSAAQALPVDDPPSTSDAGDYLLAELQVMGSILESFPVNVAGKLVDQIFDVGGFDTAGVDAVCAGADLATAPFDAFDAPF